MNNRIFLIHWNTDEAEDFAEALRTAGWDVDIEAENGARACKLIKYNKPDAVVISLSRLPSHGSVTARALHNISATAEIPIIFVDGEKRFIEKALSKVPEAIYTTSGELEEVLKKTTRR